MRKKTRRSEKRRFKRLEVRYGPEKPAHRAYAIQVSPAGAFLSTTRPIYKAGSRIVIELKTPTGIFLLDAIVRHAKNVPLSMVRLGRPGMGIEFVSLPTDLRKFLSTL